MGEVGRIQIGEHIPYTPERVWAALTDPALLASWWAGSDIAPVVGHRFKFDMGTFGQQQCEVLEVEPEAKLSYTFGEGFLDTVITWTLEAEDGGTLLTLEHAGFDLDSPIGQQGFGGMRAGWPSVLSRLTPALDEASATE